MDVIKLIHARKSESMKNVATQLEATRWRLRFLVGLAQWLRLTVKDCQILRPGRTVAATGKRFARYWRQHAGDCAFWLGSLSRFVQPSRTAKYSGLAGQSPLPEKDPRDFGGHTMATALFGRARSVASRDLLGLPDAQAWPDGRRYRQKIHTIVDATRWPLPEKKPLLYRD